MLMHNSAANGLGLGFVGGFGSHSYNPAGRDCPADGDWNTWCDCMFAGDGNLNNSCKRSYEFTTPGTWFAPWTDAGSAARGIPKEGGTGVAGSIFGTGGAADKAVQAGYDAGKSAITGSNAAPVATPGSPNAGPGTIRAFGPNVSAGFSPGTAGGGGLATIPLPYSSMSKMGTGAVLGLAALAVGGAMLFMKKKKSGGSLNGYRSRRRRR